MKKERYIIDGKRNLRFHGIECTTCEIYEYDKDERGYIHVGQAFVPGFDAEDDQCIEEYMVNGN